MRFGGDSQDVDRAGPGADLAQAVGYGLGGEALRRTRRLQWVIAPSQTRGQDRGVRASRTVRGPARVARAGQLDQPLAVEEHIDSLLAVATGDHDRGRAKGVDVSGQLLHVDIPHEG